MKMTLGNTLPSYPDFVKGIRRVPDRGYTLTPTQTVTALKNALRYIPSEWHEQLAPEFMEELRTRGRIYGYRFRPEGDLKAKPIDEYCGRCLEGKAFQVMIDNNLCFDIALYPYELVTYGETGQVCQNWMQYRLIKQYLGELTQEQTLVIESGHPLGLFRSRPDAPRVIITNSMMIGQFDNQHDWHIAAQMGVANYGQMTAGGWMYIGPQGIVHGTFNTLLKAFRLSKKADLIAALSLEAFDGRIDPFMDCIQQIRPHRGQIEAGEAFRKLLAGCESIERHKEHVQDPYSFRCIPQVHGATKDAIRYVASVLLTEINSVTDNPTIFPDEDRIISGGNFHGQPLAISYDFLAIALAELGNISERRVSQLIMGLRGLPEFLVANPGLNSGFMIPQYAAASMVSQNKMYCYVASSDSIVSSNGQEDHVSMGANAATKLYKLMDNLEHILAIELMNAAQGIDFRRPLKTSPVLERFLHAYRKEVPFVKDDIVMYKEIHKTVAFLKRNQIEY